MKKIKLLLLLLLLSSASAYSQLQQIKIVSFTVKNQLPAVIDNWGNTPGSLLLVAQLPPNVQVKGIRLMVQIKGGGAIVCSNNSAGGLQVDEFTTRTFSANELTGSLQGCHDLKEGSYSICVQFFNVDRVAISNEVCKEFSVEAPRDVEYNPPTLINPENGKVFTEAELSRPVTFRWTPLVPKPRDPVTYRLKVWQLMQGQNSTEAMRTNQPIVTKDVDNITQAVVNGIYTGPCRPPYLCDYVWQVQALNREGKPIGKNEGKSESYLFKVETNTTTSTAPQLVSPNDGKAFAPNEMSAPVMFRWTPLVPKPQTVIYRLKVWQLMQGQTGAQAMRTNPPIVTKDVDNITQAVVTGIYTGPCRPPYLCDYVWQVQAVDREGKPMGNNEGKSELWAFKVGESGFTSCSPPKLAAPADAKSFAPKDMSAPVLFRWTPIVPKPQEPVTYRLKVWQLMQGQSGSQAMRENKPIVEKEMMLTEASVPGIYTGPCKPPYLCDFIWEVQALNREGKPICSNEGKSEAFTFRVADNAAGQCSPPKLSEPAEAKSFAPKDASRGITFRWTPIVPKPQESVTYRIKVWQLMQGQTGTQAMRENKPIVEKEMMLTEATISNIYTGPCKPPYLCDFIWQVQALDREGKPVCAINEGKSESWKFSVSENTNPGNGNNPIAMVVSGANAEFKIDSAVCLRKENGLFKYHIWAHYKNQSSSTNSILINDALNFTGCAGNPNPGPQTNLRNNIRVKTGTYNPSLTMTDIIDVTSGTISNIVPLPTSFPASLPPGTNLPFQFDYSTATNTPVQFTFYGLVDDGMKFTCAKNTRNEYDSLKYPKCPCSACDEITINTSLQGNITNNGNGSLSFTALVSATPKKVKRIRAELVYFDMKPDDENCLVCNKNSTYFGNFTNAATTNNNFTAALPFPHSAQFDAVGDIDISGGVPINFTVTIPIMVSCCNANVNFCIRYVITFEDCTVCNKLACYNYKITGCQKQ